jgi:hypothetical protein
MSFAIANNLLTPNVRATDLGISPWATVITTSYNNFENLKDGPLVWNIPRGVHKPSQIAHSKTHGE